MFGEWSRLKQGSRLLDPLGRSSDGNLQQSSRTGGWYFRIRCSDHPRASRERNNFAADFTTILLIVREKPRLGRILLWQLLLSSQYSSPFEFSRYFRPSPRLLIRRDFVSCKRRSSFDSLDYLLRGNRSSQLTQAIWYRRLRLEISRSDQF